MLASCISVDVPFSWTEIIFAPNGLNHSDIWISWNLQDAVKYVSQDMFDMWIENYTHIIIDSVLLALLAMVHWACISFISRVFFFRTSIHFYRAPGGYSFGTEWFLSRRYYCFQYDSLWMIQFPLRMMFLELHCLRVCVVARGRSTNSSQNILTSRLSPSYAFFLFRYGPSKRDELRDIRIACSIGISSWSICCWYRCVCWMKLWAYSSRICMNSALEKDAYLRWNATVYFVYGYVTVKSNIMTP